MDWVFWIGIAIGAILSLAASVVANLTHSRDQEQRLARLV
jgi:hypothetical protein